MKRNALLWSSLQLVHLIHALPQAPWPQSQEAHEHASQNSNQPWWQGGYADSLVTALGYGIKQNDPPDAAPRRQALPSDNPVPGSRKVKIRSGPYMVPSMNRFTLETGEHGMLWNFGDKEIAKPCEECVILQQVAGLEYANGTIANIDSGLWLHHMVHFTIGPTRWDSVCINKNSLPHLGIRESPRVAERFFSSGNERSVFNFNPNWAPSKDAEQGNGGSSSNAKGKGTGYYLSKDDKFAYLVDLMNMNMDNKLVYMTMTYDVLDGPLPLDWEQVKVFWLDANSCGTSEVPAPQQTGSFTIESDPWTPTFEGKLLFSMGHLHDGGTATELNVGNGRTVCRQTTHYSETPAYKYTAGPMGDDVVAVDHISSMTDCTKQVDGVPLTKSRDWVLKGHYNYDQHAGNIDRGQQGEVMAISLNVVAVGRNAPRPPPPPPSRWWSHEAD